MILIADGGSTKADWIALDTNKEEVFRISNNVFQYSREHFNLNSFTSYRNQ